MRSLPTSLNFFSRLPPRLLLTSCIAFPCVTFDIHLSSRQGQRRSFLKPSTLDGLFSTPTPIRQLTHSRVLPYPRSAVFNTLASVDKYPSFLPFVLSARVSERDQNGLPARASLRVGYDAMGIEENWDSIVNAEEEQGIIEARNADTGESTEEGIFEVLKTKWQLHDLEDIRRQGVGVGAQTAVRLDVEVKFRSAMYDKLFAGVEEKVAGIMVGAFEKRIKELVET
jgi:coenzyme Q-binding protein COQ10